MSLNYLCSLPLPDAWFDELSARAPQITIQRVSAESTPDPAALAAVDFLHTGDWFPDATLMPSLRGIQLDTSGVDHVRKTSFWGLDVPIATLGGIAPVPMAEYALMAMLALAHRVPQIRELTDQRNWPSNAERLSDLTPRQLSGATLGIVGYGRIGREISRLARVLGMNVLGVSRSGVQRTDAEVFDTGRLSSAEDATELFPMSDLDSVLSRSDFLVVVVPFTELTKGMLGADELDLLPEGAFVINIARGGIVDEKALLHRLRAGRISGVALDVFDDEPLPETSHWWREPRALITPHVAGLAPQYQAQTLDLVVENLSRMAENRPLLNEVNRVAGY